MKYSDNIIYFYDMKTPTGAILGNGVLQTKAETIVFINHIYHSPNNFHT